MNTIILQPPGQFSQDTTPRPALSAITQLQDYPTLNPHYINPRPIKQLMSHHLLRIRLFFFSQLPRMRRDLRVRPWTLSLGQSARIDDRDTIDDLQAQISTGRNPQLQYGGGKGLPWQTEADCWAQSTNLASHSPTLLVSNS
jgi:hypothetical protein